MIPARISKDSERMTRTSRTRMIHAKLNATYEKDDICKKLFYLLYDLGEYVKKKHHMVLHIIDGILCTSQDILTIFITII